MATQLSVAQPTRLRTDMKTITSEFGSFRLEEELDVYYLYLDTIKIGYFKSTATDPESEKIRYDVAVRVVNAYLSIMRFESKLGMFVSIPLNNAFKDAYLRMQIESLGQTLEVRKFIEDYDSAHEWIVYPKTAEFYQLEEHFDTCDVAFITPYGRYEIYKISTEQYQILRTREGSTSILADINIPYSIRGYLEFDLTHTALVQMANTILSDSSDTMNRKSIEIGKRTSEAIKYMFNYDKLRRALRNRGIQ